MYVLDTARPQEVTVEASMDGQQIVNKFILKAGVGAAPGTSDFLLANFRVNYRTNILPLLYDSYVVNRYVMREIADVQLAMGSLTRYRNAYNPIGKEILLGAGVPDTGTRVLAALQARLPAHETIRVLKTPIGFWVGYFAGDYNRFTSWTTSEKSATRELWLAGAVTIANTAFNAFKIFTMDALAGAGSPWYQGMWSAQYFGKVVKPPGQSISFAVRYVDQFVMSPYIGTQISRRYTPAGSPQGR